MTIDHLDEVLHSLECLESKLQKNIKIRHIYLTFKGILTCDTPRRVTRIQKRVCPLLTEPPNPVRSVSMSVLNLVWTTLTVLSNMMDNDVTGEEE